MRVKLCNNFFYLYPHSQCIEWKRNSNDESRINVQGNTRERAKVGKRQLGLLISARYTQSIKLHSIQTKTIFPFLKYILLHTHFFFLSRCCILCELCVCTSSFWQYFFVAIQRPVYAKVHLFILRKLFFNFNIDPKIHCMRVQRKLWKQKTNTHKKHQQQNRLTYTIVVMANQSVSVTLNDIHVRRY